MRLNAARGSERCRVRCLDKLCLFFDLCYLELVCCLTTSIQDEQENSQKHLFHNLFYFPCIVFFYLHPIIRFH